MVLEPPVSHITNRQRQLSLPSLQGRQVEYWPAWFGLKHGAFTCVGWQVKLCETIRQVTFSSSEMGFNEEL